MKFESHAETLNANLYVTNTAKSASFLNDGMARSIIQLKSNGLPFKSASLEFGAFRPRLEQIYYRELDRIEMIEAMASKLACIQRAVSYPLGRWMSNEPRAPRWSALCSEKHAAFRNKVLAPLHDHWTFSSLAS